MPMPHLVRRKGRYWSLEESYRDERGKPRKRVLRYLGLYRVDWRATLGPNLDSGVDWDAIERDELARQEREERAREEKLAALPAGLHVGPTDPAPLHFPSHDNIPHAEEEEALAESKPDAPPAPDDAPPQGSDQAPSAEPQSEGDGVL